MLNSTKNAISEIKTERLSIYPYRGDWNDARLAELHEIFSDEKTMEFYPQFIPEEERPLQRLLGILENVGVHIFPFINIIEDKIIGFVALNNAEEYCKRIEIGYFLSSKYWGKGYAREIVSGLINCLKSQGWHRIEATVYSGNESSEKLLCSCGFTLEGILRDKYIINGKYHDDIIYSIICNSEN